MMVMSIACTWRFAEPGRDGGQAEAARGFPAPLAGNHLIVAARHGRTTISCTTPTALMEAASSLRASGLTTARLIWIVLQIIQRNVMDFIGVGPQRGGNDGDRGRRDGRDGSRVSSPRPSTAFVGGGRHELSNEQLATRQCGATAAFVNGETLADAPNRTIIGALSGA